MRSFIRSLVGVFAAALIALHFGAAAMAAQTSADLSIEKYTFSDPAAAGSDLSYFIFVFNNGGDDAQNVVVTDVLPADVTFQSATPESCTFDTPSHTVTCDLGTVTAFDGAFLEIGVRTAPFPGTIVNTATVSSATLDPDPANNSSTVSTEVVQFNLSDLAVTMTASADTVLVHRAVTFTTTVTNLGPNEAAGVQLTLSPPFLADIISVTPSQGACTTTDDNIECLLGPMVTGARATVALEVKPQKDGFALTFASVSGYGDPQFLDPNSGNDFAYVSVDVNYPGNADPSFTTTTSQKIPYSTAVYNPCTGDVIYLSGVAHEVVSLTLNKNRFRTSTFTNYHGVTGIGVISGTTYTAKGVSHTGSGLSLVFNGLFPKEVTMLDSFSLVGDDHSRLQLHQNTHLTINANGTFTAVVDNPSLVCK